ncbi:ABC transporter permease [Desulfocurvus sp. DL9XJH121]
MPEPGRISGLGASLLRLRGLVRKESLQMVRDPSSILIGLVMPVVLLFLFGYGVSLDAEDVSLALVVERPSARATDFAGRLAGTRYLRPVGVASMAEAETLLRSGVVDGVVRLRADFARKFEAGEGEIQVLVNGVDANRARQVAGYVASALDNWGAALRLREGGSPPPVSVAPRIWFNAASKSRNYLVPGLMVLIMTLIGSLLTALVMAREWERGTMEALLATPVRIWELLLGKVAPYFVLGMGGFCLTVLMAVFLFGVPLRGSLFCLAGVTALFLITALGMGLFISVVAKNQFVAGQIAILATFLPAFFLSDFIFDLHSAPGFIQAVSMIVAAKYFAAMVISIFLAGDAAGVIAPNALALFALAAFFLGVARLRTRKSLE